MRLSRVGATFLENTAKRPCSLHNSSHDGIVEMPFGDGSCYFWTVDASLQGTFLPEPRITVEMSTSAKVESSSMV